VKTAEFSAEQAAFALERAWGALSAHDIVESSNAHSPEDFDILPTGGA
jgi:hypothetical protein